MLARMGLLYTMAIVVGGIVAMLLLGLVWTVYRSVVGQCSTHAKVLLGDPEVLAPVMREAEALDPWARAHDFEFQGLFQLLTPGNSPVWIALWEQADITEPGDIFLAGYVLPIPGGRVRLAAQEFVSLYDQDRSLSTSNSTASMLFPPRPGHFKQGFPGAGLDDLWRMHQDGEQALRQPFQVRAFHDDRLLEDVLIDSVRRTARHVRSYFLWPVRALGWYATQSLRARRTIAQQLARGDIRAR